MEEDIKYFEKKLFESLAIPKEFLKSGQSYSSAAVAFQSMSKVWRDMGINISEQLKHMNDDKEELRILNKSW